MLNETELTEIKTRCDAATSGDWKAEHKCLNSNSLLTTPAIRAPRGDRHSTTLARVGAGNRYYECPERKQIENDAEFIAHSRQDIPALLQHIAELETKLRAAEQITAPDRH